MTTPITKRLHAAMAGSGFPPELKSTFKEGVVCYGAGDFDRAAMLFASVAEREPRYPSALSNLALCHFKRNEYGAAESVYRQAVAAFPADAGAMFGLAASLHQAGRLDEACEIYRAVLAIDRNHASALENLGNALRDLGRFDEAIGFYRQSLAAKPDNHVCRLSYSSALFYREDWAEAWRMFEARLDVARIVPPLEIRSGSDNSLRKLPHWVEGPQPRSLLAIAEQGIGDTIQFARFLPELTRTGSKVTLMVRRDLWALLGTLDAPITFTSEGERAAIKGVRGWLPLLSLPLALGLRPGGLVPKIPYLAAEPQRLARWKQRLGSHGFKVGIAWQGNPVSSVDRGRSLPLSAFAPLAAIPNIRLISLQKGFGEEQIASAPFRDQIETLGRDYDAPPDILLDSAAIMMSLDLVICSDSAIAHLAGALGRPFWVLLKKAPNWRWLYSGEASPFYPTARLFRQESAGDWAGVMNRVVEELSGLAGAPRVRTIPS